MNQTSKTTAWAYLVVSDPGQADTLTDQEAWARETARANDWAITNTISGVSSGKLGARKLTQELIDELTFLTLADRPARLLMIRLERLGRGDGIAALEAFTTLRRLGVVVHTRLDGDVGYNRASDLLMPVMRFFIGGMENEVRRDKVCALYERRRVAQKDDPTLAISAKMPYGLQLRDGHYAPKAPEDVAVRLAFELKTQGYGSHLIAKRLAIVAPPMTLKDGSEHPQRWTADRVQRLLTKRPYCGTIVDEPTWLRAQIPIKSVARPAQRYEYPLSGALRCHCGYMLYGQKGPRPTSAFRYYTCRNQAGHKGKFRCHRSDLLESQFVSLLTQLSVDDGLLKRYLRERNPDKTIDTVCSALTAARSELSRIDERKRLVFSAFESGALAAADLQWRLNDLHAAEHELQSRITSLERELSEAKGQRRKAGEIKALVCNAAATWLSANIDDRRTFSRAISAALGGFVVLEDTTLIVGAPRVTPVRSPKLCKQKGHGRHSELPELQEN